MSGAPTGRSRTVAVGRVGRPHGLAGAFVLRDARTELAAGDAVSIGERSYTVSALAGAPGRRLVTLAGVGDRAAAAALTGEAVWTEQAEIEPAADEWLVDDLIGCRVEGLGEVRRIVGGPSCDVLELESGQLIPLVSDAIVGIDVDARSISVDLHFLGIEDGAGDQT